jgi:DNA-3-methyladenine glycosylase II
VAKQHRVLDSAALKVGSGVLRRADPVLGAFIARSGACEIVLRPNPMHGLIRSILHQQLAGAAARAIESRFVAHFGGRYPSRRALRAASPETLRELGLSRQKAETVRRIAEAFDTGQLSTRALRVADDEAVVADLTQVKGVGPWTAHMMLIFNLGRTDILPTGDFGVRKGAMRLFQLESMPKPAELEALAEPWRPYRSIATWYLWRAADADPGTLSV